MNRYKKFLEPYVYEHLIYKFVYKINLNLWGTEFDEYITSRYV